MWYNVLYDPPWPRPPRATGPTDCHPPPITSTVHLHLDLHHSTGTSRQLPRSWSGPGPGPDDRTTEAVRVSSRTADLRDRNLALAFHGRGDRVHDSEGRVVLNLGKHAVAAIGLVQVRVGAEVDEELRVSTVGHVPMSNRRGASRVRHPRPDCARRPLLRGWARERGWASELCGLTAGLVDLEIFRCGLSGPVQSALDDKVAAIEGAAVIDTVLRELTDVCRGRGSSVRSKLHPDDAELCLYGERHWREVVVVEEE